MWSILTIWSKLQAFPPFWSFSLQEGISYFYRPGGQSKKSPYCKVIYYGQKSALKGRFWPNLMTANPAHFLASRVAPSVRFVGVWEWGGFWSFLTTFFKSPKNGPATSLHLGVWQGWALPLTFLTKNDQKIGKNSTRIFAKNRVEFSIIFGLTSSKIFW